MSKVSKERSSKASEHQGAEQDSQFAGEGKSRVVFVDAGPTLLAFSDENQQKEIQDAQALRAAMAG
jgi:hypothetical protein